MGKATEIRERNKREIKNALTNSLRQGSNIVKACQNANIDRVTFYRWLDADVHFRQAVYFAKKSRVHMVEDALYRTAVEGDVNAIKFFLTNRDPEKWKDKGTLVNQGIIQQGADGAQMMPVQINVVGVGDGNCLAEESPDRIIRQERQI